MAPSIYAKHVQYVNLVSMNQKLTMSEELLYCPMSKRTNPSKVPSNKTVKKDITDDGDFEDILKRTCDYDLIWLIWLLITIILNYSKLFVLHLQINAD